jgi:F-type H+-transporting ATPase subunit a
LVARLRLIAILGVFLVLLGVGFFYLRGPKPVIEIKGETLWTIGDFTVTLAGFKIVDEGIHITNTLFTSWCVVAFIIVLAFLSTRKLSIIPSGLQNLMEALIELLYGLVHNTVGDRHARRFFPAIATIFILVMITNWFALLPFFNAFGKVEKLGPEEAHFHEEAVVFEDSGVPLIMPGAKELEFEEIDEAPCEDLDGAAHEECVTDLRAEAIAAEYEDEGVDPDATVGLIAPYFRSVNTDLMSPLSLAIASAIFVEWWGISTLGFVAYGSKFFNFGRLFRGGFMGAIDFFVGILEFIAELARLISFSFRLFGNMLAGEILLLIMTFLIPLFLALPFYGLELFVGAIQAFVFAMLTLVFGALAVSGHGEGHEEHANVTDAGEAPAH